MAYLMPTLGMGERYSTVMTRFLDSIISQTLHPQWFRESPSIKKNAAYDGLVIKKPSGTFRRAAERLSKGITAMIDQTFFNRYPGESDQHFILRIVCPSLKTDLRFRRFLAGLISELDSKSAAPKAVSHE